MAFRKKNEQNASENGGAKAERKPRTPEQAAEAKKRAEEKRKALHEMTAFLAGKMDLFTDAADKDKLAGFLRTLKPQRSATPAIKTTIQDLLLGVFAGEQTANDFAFFQKMRYGKSEMRRAIILACKSGEPEKRLWIEAVDEADGSTSYHIRGTGANPPSGWTGYVPPTEAPATV